jgi:group I intron endonuclease
MKKVFIYGLIDPISNQIRYIGKTNDIKRRLKRHINERFLHDSHKDRWIRKLIDSGNYPEIELIEVVPFENWIFWEKFYISYFKYIGGNLTNGTNGGDEPPSSKGRKHTLESRLKMSNTKKGKPIPWLNKGTKRSDEHRNNLSKSCKGRVSPNKGKIFNEEYRKKLSDSSTSKRKVKQLHADGSMIKIWESIAAAQKALQIRHISEVCKGNTSYKTSGGYKWEYFD